MGTKPRSAELVRYFKNSAIPPSKHNSTRFPKPLLNNISSFHSHFPHPISTPTLPPATHGKHSPYLSSQLLLFHLLTFTQISSSPQCTKEEPSFCVVSFSVLTGFSFWLFLIKRSDSDLSFGESID